MVQQIGNPVQGHRGFSASRRPLDHQDLILCIPDNGVLLLLDRAHNIFQLGITVGSQLLFQDVVIDLHITLKFIDHPAAPDLVLPFGADLPMQPPARRLIGRRPPVIIVKQSADRSAPVIDQRDPAPFFRKIPNPDMEGFRLIIAVIDKIYPSEKRRIQHPFQPPSHIQILLICIDLCQKGLAVIKILIAVLVHLRIIFPIIFVHPLDILLHKFYRFVQLPDPPPEFFHHNCQKFCSCAHTMKAPSVIIF